MIHLHKWGLDGAGTLPCEISVFDHQETLLLHLKGKVFLFYKTRIWTEKQDEIVRPVRMMRESDKRLDKQKLVVLFKWESDQDM